MCTEAFADGIRLDFVCGDEVYGSCTQLRLFLEARGQAYVLGPVELPPHPGPRGEAVLQASRCPRRRARMAGGESFEFSKD